ncbi:ABC transporter substrate-binding protein [Candidatus Nitrosotalea okcheonensis]|uniref:Solute binding protein-like protein n=1 Tax=Candidatus Nitrosotalea okcheonensis TaxID=1903276 RepID=A0A2H1FEJ0_9ARCH|nr:ABC transporter substrate-binding protein [Candidatus Nitrosotalea okcheonensis]SMH71178.1 Solute binding protein-like protein [Candidatus Nitrosotalea okcheonensis]
MKLMLVLMLALFVLGPTIAFGIKGTNFDRVQFVQYSDDNTAVQEVENGHLDMYYSAIPIDRLDDQSRQHLQIFQSSGTSYSLLINPAVSTVQFNPFSIQQVRFALNYLVDRDLIVDEILGGYGATMISAYKPYDPDYLLILGDLQSFNFKHNPVLADSMITDALEKAGAKKTGGFWYYDSKPVAISIFIRNDDPVRKSIGEILASQLQGMGFAVKKDYGDLTKAFSTVYGSNPSDLKWNIYTEGWTMGGFVRYDSVITAQMYSPWYSNMPGFNNPSYWNFQDPKVDSLSKAIFFGNFTSSEQRASLINQAVNRGINDSVRIFLACKTDQFVASKKISGIINDFGAGITSRFTPINARSDSDTLTIGVKNIYQGAWNPISGFADSASQQIWGAVSDPGSFKNPFTGYTIPVRSDWTVNTKGPLDKLDVPSDAIRWDVSKQKWVHVGPGAKATSEVTFRLKFGNWHDKTPMDMNDVLYGIYFLYQWGTDQTNGTMTFDSEYSPKANQAAKTLIGVRVVNGNTIEVYQNYWHFDSGEIADSAQVWPAMPWEMIYSMEKAVTDGKLAFSRSDAVSKNIDLMSLIIPNDAKIIKANLDEFAKENSIPPALAFVNDSKYFKSRYDASSSWIAEHGHAVISNGPYYLDNYAPDARTITIKAFDDPTYPFAAGYWKKFEQVNMPQILGISVPTSVSVGSTLVIPISVTPNATVYYYFTNPHGKVIDEGNMMSQNGTAKITLLPEKTATLELGSNDLQVFVVSDEAYKPDMYHTSFLVTKGVTLLAVDNSITSTVQPTGDNRYLFFGIISVGVAVAVSFYVVKKRRAS